MSDSFFTFTYIFATALVIILLPNISARCKYYFKFTFFCVYLLMLATVSIPILILLPTKYRSCRLYGPAAALLSKLLGIQWEIRGKKVFDKSFPCVIVINHQSALDIFVGFVLSYYTNVPKLILVAKQSLLYTFSFGLALWLCGTIFVDRKNSTDAKTKLNKITAAWITENIKDQYTQRYFKQQSWSYGQLNNGICYSFKKEAAFFIFPEGTRNAKSSLQTFKKGAFHIAIQHKIPIVPIVVSPYTFINDKPPTFNCGKSIISVLDPICTTHLDVDGLDSLVEQTKSIMEAEYQNLRKYVLFK